MKVIFTDTQPLVATELKRTFEGVPDVEVYNDPIFNFKCDAVVSPANSFGFMDGGIDAHFTKHFGTIVQDRLQETLKEKFNGELLVGQAVVIATDNEAIPYCISAPTMRVPMILGPNTVNPYLAVRAALRAAKDYDLHEIVFPGMGTGVGRVSPTIFAHQAKVAVEEVLHGSTQGFSPFPATWREAQLKHMYLYTKSTEDLQFF